jgi:prevent-host-death family protein
MIKIGSEKARKKLPELLDKAKNGEQAIITKHGVPYAIITSVDQGMLATSDGILALLGTGKGLWGDSPENFVDELREEWES